MARRVTSRSANWRLFGGGGLLLGATLWLLVEVAGGLGGLDVWVRILAFAALTIAGFSLAFGQTGSNGVVGGSLLGKLGFVAFGVGFALLALEPLLTLLGVTLPAELTTVAIVLIGIGSALGAIIAFRHGVARGIARWIFAVAAMLCVAWMLETLGLIDISSNILTILLPIALAIAGGVYLFGRR